MLPGRTSGASGAYYSINIKVKSREFFDGSTTHNRREYVAVRLNNRVSIPTHAQSRTKLFKRHQISRFVSFQSYSVVIYDYYQ